MCGRYSIYEPRDHYLKELAPEQLIINGYDLWPTERYNVAPINAHNPCPQRASRAIIHRCLLKILRPLERSHSPLTI